MLNSDQASLHSGRDYANLTGHCPNGDGNCWVGPVIGNANYQIVDTDYTTYSIVWSCSPVSEQIFYILARDPIVSQSQLNQYISMAKAAVPTYNFNNLNTPDVQGSMCHYASNSSWSNLVL